MHDQGKAVIEPRHQIFRAPLQGLYTAPFEPHDEVLRKGKAQIGAALEHTLDRRSDKGSGKAAAHGFDFG